MRLKLSFAVRGSLEEAWGRLELPMDVDLPQQGRFTISRSSEVMRGEYVSLPSLEPAEDFLFVLGEQVVDITGMRIESGRPLFEREDGSPESGGIDAEEMDSITEGALCVVGALSFATGVALEAGVFIGLEGYNRFIPEGKDDEDLLNELGTRRSSLPLQGTSGVEPFENVPIDAAFVEKLARRRSVSLYPDVLAAASPAVKFRELWRTLEFAFQAHGNSLVGHVADFPPAQRLGFDREELTELHVLRGRLSYAASRLGIADLRQADQEAIGSLGRLWSLVDAVILAKQDASGDLDVDELRELAAFIDRNGTSQVSDSVEKPAEWLGQYGLRSPRFR
ncbi:MAG TPA: hypothetical protein VFJ57_09200 [Solirubrobacterales bacterium]|nr:hypothetical protein [Solirubrobacterales bacterium]